ncbi:MAG TPA: protein kinase [Gemmatimonadales bacterium]|nr:protein kinase [Gemmatimonadales bacterium]
MTTPLERLETSLADRYRIERELGAGGMATVYLARDVKHDRDVALKVLKPELAAVLGAERFVAEIKTTASLQHPHILPLFDSGTADGFLYYVMPYVEGETLRDKLNRETQLDITEAVRITTEVADALDYAHRHGVIHRDIKPENILLHDGRPMVADFGIALALSAAAGGRMTETGLSLGTPHYMSPEQATAEKDLTNRSDIYSLGAVLYEMLTGNPPHVGASAQQIIMRIVTEDAPPVTTVRKAVPPPIAAAVSKAIERLPADRFASAPEFARALADPRFTWSPSGGAGAQAASFAAGSIRRDWRVWAGAAALTAVAVMIGRWTARSRGAEPLVARFAIPVEAQGGVTSQSANALALTSDGRTMVFASRGASGAEAQLYVRRLDELEAHPISGTQGAVSPVFSPDGKRLAYMGPGGAYVLTLPFTGGTASLVPNSQAQALSIVSWLDDGQLLMSDNQGGIVSVTLDGHSRVIAEPDARAHEQNLFLGDVLPDRRTILVVPAGGFNITGPVVAIDSRNGHRTKVLDLMVNAVWYADGCLLWSLPGGSLQGAPFDLATLKVGGTPVTVADHVQQEFGGGGQVAVSASGSLLYAVDQPLSLVLLDHAGHRQVLGEGHRFHNPRFAPDGTRIAMDLMENGNRDMWSFDLRQHTLSRLSFEQDGHDGVWTADGRWVVYQHNAGLWRRRSDGSGSPDSVYTGPDAVQALEYERDGSVLGVSLGKNGAFNVARAAPPGSRFEPLLSSLFTQEAATLSRDGRVLAYASDETGREEVYVRAFPGGAKVLVSSLGGREPRWAPDGRTLYYIGQVDGNPTLIAATIEPGPTPIVRSRAALFDASDFDPASPHANWDVSPDGTHFVIARQAPLNSVIYALNVTDEIRRRSGARP